MAGHVAKHVTKFEDLMPIRVRVTSHNVFNWIPLTLRFYRAMIRMRGASHGPVSVSVSVCVCV